jgi:transposase
MKLRRFAEGLERDYDAILAAITTSYSNSLAEGHINRLKMIKRQMYGRSSLKLLRIRVLHRDHWRNWEQSHEVRKSHYKRH